MSIKKTIKYYLFGESIKEIEMNRILDKIIKKMNITKKEKTFLDLYNQTSRNENKDYMLLSKNATCDKVKTLLEKGKIVICDLNDKDGRLGFPIINIIDNRIFMRYDDIKIKDRFLYNIIYNIKKDEYSLQEHGEYFEKIEIDK